MRVFWYTVLLVVRLLAALAVPSHEILAVLAAPAVQNPEILEVSIGSINSSEPEILRVRKYPQHRTLEYREYTHYPQYIDL